MDLLIWRQKLRKSNVMDYASIPTIAKNHVFLGLNFNVHSLISKNVPKSIFLCVCSVVDIMGIREMQIMPMDHRPQGDLASPFRSLVCMLSCLSVLLWPVLFPDPICSTSSWTQPLAICFLMYIYLYCRSTLCFFFVCLICDSKLYTADKTDSPFSVNDWDTVKPEF